MSNQIKVTYTPSIYFGNETINISINCASYGALNVFASDLKKLIRPIKNGDSFVTLTYFDMLEKLSNELTKQLLFENNAL